MFGTCAFSQSNEDGQRRRFVKKLGMGEERSPGAWGGCFKDGDTRCIYLEPDAHTHTGLYIYICVSIYIYRSLFIVYFCIYVSHVQMCGFSAQFDGDNFVRGRRKKILMTPPLGNPGGQRPAFAVDPVDPVDQSTNWATNSFFWGRKYLRLGRRKGVITGCEWLRIYERTKRLEYSILIYLVMIT